MADPTNSAAWDNHLRSIFPNQEQKMFSFDEELSIPVAGSIWESMSFLEEEMVNPYGFEKCIQDHEKKMEDRFKDIQKKMKDIQKQIEDRFQEEKREREISAKALIEMFTKGLGPVTGEHEKVCDGKSK